MSDSLCYLPDIVERLAAQAPGRIVSSGQSRDAVMREIAAGGLLERIRADERIDQTCFLTLAGLHP